MFEAPTHPYLVPFDGSFSVKQSPTAPPRGSKKGKAARELLGEAIDRLAEQQRVLYAQDRWAVLVVFQALDAAGKDSTIRAVMSGINPAGCQVFSFKRPSTEELDHDFLWRTSRCLPERGRIGIFNRSYYEEVLVVRAHAEILAGQKLPTSCLEPGAIWEQRYESIRDHERHLARNGTAILKFWLNVSKEEQRRRFLRRIERPEKNWKFSPADVEERNLWDDYRRAYEEALCATSRPWAPWYAIPADDKPHMRLSVAGILVASLERLGLRYPTVGPRELAVFEQMRSLLESAD